MTLLGLQGRALELDDVLDLVEERYLYDPDDPYDEKSSSSDDNVADDVDIDDLPAAFARSLALHTHTHTHTHTAAA